MQVRIAYMYNTLYHATLYTAPCILMQIYALHEYTHNTVHSIHRSIAWDMLYITHAMTSCMHVMTPFRGNMYLGVWHETWYLPYVQVLSICIYLDVWHRGCVLPVHACTYTSWGPSISCHVRCHVTSCQSSWAHNLYYALMYIYSTMYRLWYITMSVM